MGRFIKGPFILALDFDGTIKQGLKYDTDSSSWSPTKGFLKFYKWVQSNSNIHPVLWTCRNMKKYTLDRQAVEVFLNEYGIELDLDYAVTSSVIYIHNGYAYKKTAFGSHKIYADFYVDDLSVGFPRCFNGEPNWRAIKRQIIKVMRSKSCA